MLLTEMKIRCPVACQLISDGPHTITQDTQDVRTTESTAHTTMLKVSRRSCQRALTLNTPPRRHSFYVVASDSTTHMHFLPHSSPILSTPRSAPRHVLLKIKIKRFQPVLRSHKCVNSTVTSVIRGDQVQKRPTSKIPPPSRLVDLHVNELRCFSRHTRQTCRHTQVEKSFRADACRLHSSRPLHRSSVIFGSVVFYGRVFNHVSNFTTLPCTAPPCVDERLISQPPTPEAFSYINTARQT